MSQSARMELGRFIFFVRISVVALGGLRDISRYTNYMPCAATGEIIRHACRSMSNLGFVD